MIASLRPYPEYKGSGVPWAARIPRHWDVSPLRRLGQVQLSNVDKHTITGEVAVRLCNYTDVYRRRFITSALNFMKASALLREVHKFQLRRGDVLITKDSESWTDIAVPAYVTADMPGVLCGYHLAHIRPNHEVLNGEYLMRAFEAEPLANQFRTAATGVTRFALSGDAIAGALFPVPPRSEQDVIAAFLAAVDRLLGGAIRAKRRVIGLLTEQKQAIINRAVTRGLDPNVHLKPSGLAWLGEMPEHWEVRRNGGLFAQRNQSRFADLPILEVSLRTGVRMRTFEDSDRKQVLSDRDKYKRAVRGDIAYNMMRMWQGAVGVAPIDGLVSPAYVVARPLKGTDPRYYAELFRTAAYMSEVDKCSRGVVKDRHRLYWEDFKQMASPCPPPHEQTSIADGLEQGTRTLNHAMNHIQREIDLLSEYRIRLIVDAVTGNLDVRGVTLPALDESDLPEDAEPLGDQAEDEVFDAEEAGDADE